MATTNISCEGDREFVQDMRLLATKRHTSIGKLVREALNTVYEQDLVQIRERARIFFADDCASEFKSEPKSTNENHA